MLTESVKLRDHFGMANKLRPYQLDMKYKIYDAWQNGARNVLLVLPTGMGKTRTFSDIVIEIALGANRFPSAIMVHRKELVQQISLTLAEHGVKHNIIAPRKVIQGITAAHRLEFRKAFYDYASSISVVSVDTLNARSEQHAPWTKKIRLWVTDEAAHVLAQNKWGKALATFENAIGLGVTATPERLDKRGLGRHADGVFDVMVQGPNTRWGIENNFLSSYRIAVPESDYKAYLKEANGDSDYTREAMIAASNASRIVGDVVKEYKKHASGKQAIVFASDIGAAHRMEREFIANGYSAKTLTGETPDQERLDSLIAYRKKEIQILINVDLFDEGLDVPGIEVVIMARPTKSLGKYLQMIGRGLRIAKDKPFCIIIDHVGNVQEHGLPDSFRRWTLDRIIRRRTKVNLLRVCANSSCNSPYDRALTECPYCKTEFIPEVRSSGGGGGGKVGPERVDGDLQLLDPETLRAMYDKSVLETPAQVAERVAHVAGAAAGLKAMKNQEERIKTQEELRETIALWGGKYRASYTDRQLHKLFYSYFGMTITEMLSEPRAAMLTSIEELKGYL